MATIIQKKRLVNEIKLLSNQPLHYCTAYPDDSNPLIWYFLIIGQKGTDYYKGEYIGKIVHSPKYPTEPPDYYMLTPSGRYNVGTKICLTNSSFHKGDWSSTWNILSILIAFYSIWLDDGEYGVSHIKDTPLNRNKMANESISYNLKNYTEIYNKFDKTHLKDDISEDKKETNESKNIEVDFNLKTDSKAITTELNKKIIIHNEEEKKNNNDIDNEIKIIDNEFNIINEEIKNYNKKIIEQEKKIKKLYSKIIEKL